MEGKGAQYECMAFRLWFCKYRIFDYSINRTYEAAKVFGIWTLYVVFAMNREYRSNS